MVVRVARAVLIAADRAARVALTVTAVDREVSLVHRLVRTIRTATVTTMVRADAAARAALTVAARVVSAEVRVEQAASTVAVRADREVSDLVQVWVVVHRFLQ